MKQLIFIFQIITAVLLAITILLQQKGTGLGSTFGGGGSSQYRTKRGAEKLLFYATIALAVIFVASTLLGLVVA